MIILRNVSKSFDNKKTYILKNINLKFPDNGIVAICGPSGCGKSTLFNCLSNLLDYDGEIEINNIKINKLNETNKALFRIQNIGFIFQDFKLFETETVLENIKFPLVAASNSKEKRINQKVSDLIELVELNGKENQNVNTLSGGEKQRVSIARSLVNDPKLILADEPTGALDSENSLKVMTLLKRISEKSLVVIVSHDEELMKTFCDEIVYLNDGNIVNKIRLEKKKNNNYIPLCKNEYSNKIPNIPLKFLINHTKTNIRMKKWRSLIINSITSLSLVGVGLAITLSTSISNNIKKAYSSIIDDSKIVISSDNNNENFHQKNSIDLDNLKDIIEGDNEVNDIGVNYLNDFEKFFSSINEVSVFSTAYKNKIEGISARSINDFIWLENEERIIYPTLNKQNLENDEIICDFTINTIREICFALKIDKTVESLANYIGKNDVFLAFEFENSDWQYSDQQIFKLIGFTLSFQNRIVHSNHLWNEYVFENSMSLPSSIEIDKTESVPWILKKSYYVDVKNPDLYLKRCRNNKKYENYILEVANEQYYPWLYKNVEPKNITRILIFEKLFKDIPYNYINYFEEVESRIKNPIFGTPGGYGIYPQALMMGFNKEMYFSLNENLLDETLDAVSSLNLNLNEKENLPKGILSGHYSKSMQNGVVFTPINQNSNEKRKTLSLDEILVSRKMAELLGYNGKSINDLYIAYTSKERINSSGKIVREFKKNKLAISGVIDSDKISIFHEADWTIGFFQSRLGISSFDLACTNLSFDVDNKTEIEEIGTKLKKAFPQFDIINPLSDINSNVDTICSYLQLALLAFSGISMVISILLLWVSNYLHLLESKKEIGLARCIGLPKKESTKFIYSHSLGMSLVSFLMASVELIFLSIFASLEIGNTMGLTFSFDFNPLSLLIMFAVCIFISFVSSFSLARNVIKINPLDSLKS